jgi:hypothetical protein
MADTTAVFDSPVAAFRISEASNAGAPGMLIDVHIIAPVWGASGYYSESVLRDACRKRVYPEGMHMHLDHPTRKAEKDRPARTISGESPLAALFTGDGHYETEGWDKTPENPAGAGVYTVARVLPKFVEDLRAMAESIGISHYVDGIAEEGTAPDGRKGMIIKELLASPLNTVDFVTVPGAEGHYRTRFSEMKVRAGPIGNETQEKKMADTQALPAPVQIPMNRPGVVTGLKKQLAEELKTVTEHENPARRLEEAGIRIRALEQENTDLRRRLGEKAALDFVVAEIGKAKLPAVSGRILAETLVSRVVFAEDGSIDAAKSGEIIARGIKARQDELAEIRKEMGITGNGAGNPPAGNRTLKESFRETYLRQGMSPERAEQLAALAAAGR